MKFQITGSNQSTGARMEMQVEAESKAHAERKGREAGMNVNHVRDISDGSGAPTGVNREGAPRRSGGGGGMIKLIVIVAILAAVAFFFWPKIKSMIGM